MTAPAKKRRPSAKREARQRLAAHVDATEGPYDRERSIAQIKELTPPAGLYVARKPTTQRRKKTNPLTTPPTKTETD